MKLILKIMTFVMVFFGLALTASASEAGMSMAAASMFQPVAVNMDLLIPSLAFGGVTLAANQLRAYELGDLNDLPVIAADIIYDGAAVGDNASGFARPLVAADPFLGFATEKADNSAGAAGAVNVNVRQRGRIKLDISTLVAADLGASIYASDDNTFTKTATANTLIGKVVRFVSAGVGIVEFDVTKI